MITALQRLPANTIELTITIPWSDIKSAYDRIVSDAAKDMELPGFRKGKAPKDLVHKNLDKNKIYENVIQEILPKVYSEAIQKHDLKPIISPKIELMDAKEDKDWQIKAISCERPKVKLKNYRQAIQKLKALKKDKIWLPGEDKTPQKKNQEPALAEIYDALYPEIDIELPPVLIEQEVNRKLSNLLSETQKLGLTIEQYLSSQGKTSDGLRKDYTDQVTKELALEFGLEEVSEVEKIVVDDADIEKIISDAKTEEEKQQLQKNRYYIASMLRRQKTLEKLLKSEVLVA